MSEQCKTDPCRRDSRSVARVSSDWENRLAGFADSCEILEADETLRLRAYGRILRKRLATVLIVFFVLFVIVLIATLKQRPVYRAQVLLEIQKENPDIPTIQELYELDSVSDAYLRSQYAILASDSLARRVVDQLRLDTLPEFNSPSWWSWRKARKAPAPQTFATEPARAEREVYQRVLERFQHGLTIDPVSRSRLVAIQFDSHDPQLAARIVNSLAQNYVEQNLEARWTATQKAADWLSRQLVGVKAKLEKSEDELQDYARLNNLIFLETDKGPSRNVEDERLQRLQEELTKAEAERYEKEALYRLVQAGDYESLPGVFEDKLIEDLTERLAELKREHARLSTTFNEDYPRVKEIQSQIKEIEASIRSQRQAAADRITNDYLAAVSREELVRKAFQEQHKQIDQIAAKAVQYNILKREVDTNKLLYEGLLQRLKEASVSASLKASNIRIVDSAEPPVKPVKPKIPLNLALTAVLGMGVGVCAAFLQERLDDTLKGADSVERLFGLPALALIPATLPSNGNHAGFHKLQEHARVLGFRRNGNGSKPVVRWHRIDVDGSRQPDLVEAFRSLRTSILLASGAGPPSSLLITSTQPAEGKTTIASNLAIALTQVGRRVLLVDADLRSPSLHRLFGERERLGLTGYLAGHSEWQEVVRPSGSSRLDLLFCGPPPQNPPELFSSPRMGALIRSAQEQYEFVILDSAPMLALADSRILAPLVSGVILVVKDGTTPREQVLHVHSGIYSVGANLVGVVLNSVNLHTVGYYHYGPYRPGDNPSIEQIPLDGDSPLFSGPADGKSLAG